MAATHTSPYSNPESSFATEEIICELSSKSSSLRRGIFLLHKGAFAQIYGPEEQAKILSLVNVDHGLVTPDEFEASEQKWPGVEMIFSGWGMPKCDEEFLERFPDLKMVFYGAGSVRGFTTEAFWDRPVRVTSAYAANAVPVSEFTLSQILFSLKQGWQVVLRNHIRKNKPFRHSPPGAYGSVVGLISLGMAGRLVRERLRPFDLKVIAYDPFVDEEDAVRLDVTMVGLDEIFSTADVVSCHVPWLPETEKMIRGSHFAAMKEGATFINTARGAVVNEQEMIKVLEKRPDLMAVLDVTYPEPPLKDSPLHWLENVVLTPHIAGSMGRECQRMGATMVEELERYLARKPLRYEIDSQRATILA